VRSFFSPHASSSFIFHLVLPSLLLLATNSSHYRYGRLNWTIVLNFIFVIFILKTGKETVLESSLSETSLVLFTCKITPLIL
jgi:hypothetical protein